MGLAADDVQTLVILTVATLSLMRHPATTDCVAPFPTA